LGDTDSLRDKLQTLSIFIFILDQIDKPSGVRIMGPNTLATFSAFHRVVSPWIQTEFNLVFAAFRFGVLAFNFDFPQFDYGGFPFSWF
jgi:hypothetical protein